jgi:hypothetical protein
MRVPSDRSDKSPTDARAVFLLGIVFMAVAVLTMLLGVSDVPGDIHACSSRSPFVSVARGLLILYWVNCLLGLVYLALVARWWFAERRPWSRTNALSFSRTAWAGIAAWQDATVRVLHDLRRLRQLRPIVRANYLGHALLWTSVILSTVILALAFGTCSTCPSGWDGRCTGALGSVCASSLVGLMYYDLRVKFTSTAAIVLE